MARTQYGPTRTINTTAGRSHCSYKERLIKPKFSRFGRYLEVPDRVHKAVPVLLLVVDG